MNDINPLASGMNEKIAEKSCVLSCKNITKIYQQGPLKADVLDNVDLSIYSKETVAIIGASGSGKSTLLHLLGGLDVATSGTISILGQDISTLSETALGRLRNKALGFVYQFHHLLPEFTALENVAMPLLIRGESTTKARNEATQILTKVGLDHRLQHKPGELSGGERQRAAIARALVTRPACLLADEPTGNLDRQTAENVFQLMLELNHHLSTSLVIVTHDSTLASKADRIMCLSDGKLKPQI